MTSAFKDKKEQTQFTKNIGKILRSDEFQKILKTSKEQGIDSYNQWQTLTRNTVNQIATLIQKTTSKKIEFSEKFFDDLVYHSNFLASWTPLDIFIDGIHYTINFNAYVQSISLKRAVSAEEELSQRSSVETDYAVINDKFGREALVKFIDGDRRVFGKSRYIKKEFIDENDEDSIKALFRLNPEGLKNENK